jgi:hypothetical protein
MKTMLDTKIYNDNWFYNLSTDAKLLFLFLISNDSRNLIGCYELPLNIICTYTKISEKSIVKVFEELEPKVEQADGWIIIKNYDKYNPMRNPSIEEAKKKQMDNLPELIRDTLLMVKLGPEGILKLPEDGLDTLYTGYKVTEQEKDINKREIVKREIDNISEEQIQEICKDYQVPESFVRSKMDDIKNYTASTGKKYKDYIATLRNWVKKDSLTLRKEASQHESKRGIDARGIV